MSNLSRKASNVLITSRKEDGVSSFPLVEDLMKREAVSFETKLISFTFFVSSCFLSYKLYRRRREKKNVTIGETTIFSEEEKESSIHLREEEMGSQVRYFAFRLLPNMEIKGSIDSFVKGKNIKAGSVVSCAGSTSYAKLRLANAKAGDVNHFLEVEKKGEIVSLSGTVSIHGLHLHMGIAMDDGQVVGGHLTEAIVNTTCELVIAVLADYEFTRPLDASTKFKELSVVKL